MNGNKAKLKFNPNNFEILENGDYVICAVSGKNIPLNQFPGHVFTDLHFRPSRQCYRHVA